mgnify:FL=1
MSHVSPVEMFPLFTVAELQAILCGHSDFDIDLLKAVVEYKGYKELEWEALREISNAERKKFFNLFRGERDFT